MYIKTNAQQWHARLSLTEGQPLLADGIWHKSGGQTLQSVTRDIISSLIIFLIRLALCSVSLLVECKRDATSEKARDILLAATRSDGETPAETF